MTRSAAISPVTYEWADIFCGEHRGTPAVEMVALAYMAGQASVAAVHPGLTARQHRAFDVIKAFIEANVVSPTMREIAQGMGITLSRAHSVVKQLEHRGLIAMVPRCPRSISIIVRNDDVSTAHKISEVVA